MIHVMARVSLRKGATQLFLKEFREVAILVRQEPGCLDYFPARDVPMNLSGQRYDSEAITIVEKWSGPRALESHLRSGHMRSFQERVSEIVTDVSLSIVEEL